MSKFIWLPEHCEHLRSLRIAAGIDISTLASNHSLSKMQVKQLEEGGDSAFYTPEIKFSMGRKLIRSFGVDVIHIQQNEISVESDFSNVDSELPVPKDGKTTLEKSKIVLEIFKSKVLINAYYLVLFVLCFSTLIFFSTSINWFHYSESVSKEIIPPKPELHKGPPSIDPIKGAISSENMNKNNLSVVCDWKTHSVEKSPPNPTKPGDYVHLISSESVSVCVMDHANEIKTLSFKPMEAKTVHGQPPFKIFSHEFSKIKLYYQGNLIRITEPFPKQIILNEKS